MLQGSFFRRGGLRGTIPGLVKEPEKRQHDSYEYDGEPFASALVAAWEHDPA